MKDFIKESTHSASIKSSEAQTSPIRVSVTSCGDSSKVRAVQVKNFSFFPSIGSTGSQ